MTNTADRVLAHFLLGQHTVKVTADTDGTLTLSLDGCVRKSRPSGPRGTYLWTNVELPFEDHHLVEVRRAAPPATRVEVFVNGHLQQPSEVYAA